MEKTIEKIILKAIEEDLIPKGDITSECLILPNHNSSFKLVVNQNAILAGIEIFKKTFLLLDVNLNVKTNFPDGAHIKKNEVVAEVSGITRSILKAERTALNFVSFLSGIATMTSELKNLIKHTNTELLDTRKTTPNLRLLIKKAVLAGGGKNHRFNLSEMVLIKDNHIDVFESVKKAVSKIKRSYNGKMKVEVEVRNLAELNEAISSKVDIIMFDNWNVNELRDAIKLVPKEVLTEVSGQITPQNIKSYAECGVNYISTSYMVKNAKWIDFSLGRGELVVRPKRT